MSTKFQAASLVFLLVLVAGCKDHSASAEGAKTSAETSSADTAQPPRALPVVPPSDKQALRQFLLSTPGTYGWQTAAESVTFDFFADGRLAIQGPDGEATMWEGRWELSEDTLILKRADLGKTLIVTAKQEGKTLILGDQIYTRVIERNR